MPWSTLPTRGKEGARARHGHSACTLGGRIHVYAGRSAATHDVPQAYLNSLIVLEPSGLHWQAVSTAMRPPARGFHSANALPCDTRMLVFGGASPSPNALSLAPIYLNDVWLYKCTVKAWEACSVDGEPPNGRAAHSAVLLAAHKPKLVVFGGTDGRAAFNDLWLLSIATPRWEQVVTSGVVPSARCYHTCALGTGGTMMLFGGRDQRRMAGPSAYLLDLSTRVWTEVRAEGDDSSAVPTRGRSSHSCVVHKEYAIIFGGKVSPEADHAEKKVADSTSSILVFDLARKAWLAPPDSLVGSQLPSARGGDAPPALARSAHSASVGMTPPCMVVVGGYARRGEANDAGARWLDSKPLTLSLASLLPGAPQPPAAGRLSERQAAARISPSPCSVDGEAEARHATRGTKRAVPDEPDEMRPPARRQHRGSSADGSAGAHAIIAAAKAKAEEAEEIRMRLSAERELPEAAEAACSEAGGREQRAMEGRRAAESEARDLRRQLDELGVRGRGEREGIAEARAAEERASRTATQLQAKNDELASRLDELSASQRRHEERCSALDEQLREARSHLSNATVELAHERGQRKELQLANERWASNLQRLGDSLAVQESNVKRHEERERLLDKQLDGSHAALRAAEEREGELEAECGRLKHEAEQAASEHASRGEEMARSELARAQASARVATLEVELRGATERTGRLENELSAAQAARDKLESQWRTSAARERALESQLAACAAERAHAAERLGGLPEALRMLQARLNDTLLRPIDETLRLELAPPQPAAYPPRTESGSDDLVGTVPSV